MNKKILSIGLIAVFTASIGFGFYKLSNDKKVKAELTSGIKYYSSGDYDKSILAYEKVLKIDKKNADAYVGLARAYSLKGDIQKAQETLNSAVKALPKEPKVLVESAFIASENNKIEEAIEVYKKALNLEPNNSQALSGLYADYIEKGDKENADKLMKDSLEKLSSLNPLVVSSLIKTKDWEKAIALLSEAYKKDKEDIAIYDALSNFRNADKNFISVLKKKVEDNPSDSMYKMLYISLCNSKELVEEGLNIANSIEGEFKDSQAYKLSLADLYDIKGDKEQVQRIYEELEKAFPNDYRVLHNIGWHYYEQKDYEKAIEYGKKSIEANPEYRDNYAYLIPSSLFKIEKYGEAIPYLNTALRYNPGDDGLIYDISYAYFESNKFNEALSYLNKCSILNPDNIDYKLMLAICYNKLNNNSRALELANELISKYPDNSTYKFLKASLLAIGGEADEALRIYQSLPEEYKSTYKYVNNVACVRYKLSDGAEEDKALAIEELRKAQQIASNKGLNKVVAEIERSITSVETGEGQLWYYYC